MTTATATRPFIPATDAQLRYIEALFTERNLDHAGGAGRLLMANYREQAQKAGIDKRGASFVIGELTKFPRKPAAAPKNPTGETADVPEGRYLVDGTIYRVDRPVGGRWDGWTFVKVTDGHGREVRRLRGREAGAALAAIAEAGPLNAATAYGKATGECGQCGRVLTNPDSIARGIGPICAAKL